MRKAPAFAGAFVVVAIAVVALVEPVRLRHHPIGHFDVESLESLVKMLNVCHVRIINNTVLTNAKANIVSTISKELDRSKANVLAPKLMLDIGHIVTKGSGNDRVESVKTVVKLVGRVDKA